MFVTYINHINVSQISAVVEFTSAFRVSTVAAVCAKMQSIFVYYVTL